MVMAIKTQYLGPTNFRGSRIKASIMYSTDKLPFSMRPVSFEWDSALSSMGNHKRAAMALIKRAEWTGRWCAGDADKFYVWIKAPADYDADGITI